MSDEFSVFQFFSNGGCERVRRSVTLEEAVKAARVYCSNPAARAGITRRVIVVDSDDLTCFEWVHSRGITFPPEAARPWP